MTTTREELALILVQQTNRSTRECAQIVDLFFEAITESLERGEGVKIQGFGNFKIREKAARKGRNPQNGEPLEISARRVLAFKPSRLLREKLAAHGQEPTKECGT